MTNTLHVHRYIVCEIISSIDTKTALRWLTIQSALLLVLWLLFDGHKYIQLNKGLHITNTVYDGIMSY